MLVVTWFSINISDYTYKYTIKRYFVLKTLGKLYNWWTLVTKPRTLLQIQWPVHIATIWVGGPRTVPLQGLERDKPLQVGPGLSVPLPDRVQLEPRPGEHLEVRQDRVQGLWKNITIFQPIYEDEQVSVNHQHHHHRDIQYLVTRWF